MNSYVFEPIRQPQWLPWPLIGLDIFDFYLFSHWTDFDETWQEASTRSPPPTLSFFSGWSTNKDGHPVHWFVDKFSTSLLHSLNGFFPTELDRKQQLLLRVIYQVCLFVWVFFFLGGGGVADPSTNSDHWFAETFWTSPSPAAVYWTNLDETA